MTKHLDRLGFLSVHLEVIYCFTITHPQTISHSQNTTNPIFSLRGLYISTVDQCMRKARHLARLDIRPASEKPRMSRKRRLALPLPLSSTPVIVTSPIPERTPQSIGSVLEVQLVAQYIKESCDWPIATVPHVKSFEQYPSFPQKNLATTESVEHGFEARNFHWQSHSQSRYA